MFHLLYGHKKWLWNLQQIVADNIISTLVKLDGVSMRYKRNETNGSNNVQYSIYILFFFSFVFFIL